MANGFSCTCASCRARALRWPLLLIGAGVLFSLDLIWHVWPMYQTWPALLILWGVLALAARLAPDTRHGVGLGPSPPFGDSGSPFREPPSSFREPPSAFSEPPSASGG